MYFSLSPKILRPQARSTGGTYQETSRMDGSAVVDDRDSSRDRVLDWWEPRLQAAIRFARAHGVPAVEAEDIAQDALLSVLTQADAGGEIEKVESYLFVTIGRLWNRRRQAARRAAAEPTAPPGFDLPQHDLHLDLVGVIERQPVRSQALLRMAVDGYSHAEMAVALGCQTRDVGSMLKRAQQRAVQLYAAGRRRQGSPGARGRKSK